ncbi:hypothetical protein [Streptomyces sp. ICBB 8177]|uniref:hypothetical protein n=1 Tax=Streptomyces sp. ICBB 8177 TaxID=563922 RepID=UPI000D6781B3|nr:hypothetical protein [Streptomyces sp. ICBB 8177]PWI44694.1 hypothetical protein CK485_08195 [Streptomyces sp. ICBB 8177]
MIRLRIQRAVLPRPALILTDTPRPNCPQCLGDGGIEWPYGDETGEYAGSEWEWCGCWNERLRWTLLLLPCRKSGTAYTDEPPF